MIRLRGVGSPSDPTKQHSFAARRASRFGGQALGDAVRAARARLVHAGIPEPEAALDAAALAMQALQCDRASLLVRDREPPPPSFHDAFEALRRRREAREPMAYIRGTQEFWGRDFLVSPDVLIPRPETELLVEEALAWRRHRSATTVTPPLVIDIGTGSGCLAVTMACEWPDAGLVATDLSAAALVVARDNARRHQVEDRIRFVSGAYFADVSGMIDLVLANPPYIPDDEGVSLQPEVRDFEPAVALLGGADGLRDVRAILEAASGRLAIDGRLLMEIGAGQAEAVRDAVRGTPRLSLLDIRADLQGIPRTAIVIRR